jgi:hypothetical protein
MPQPLIDLGKCSISALLDMGVDTKTFCPWFKFAALTQLLTLRVAGMVYMTFSHAWEDRFSDGTNVVEVSSERRGITIDDLSGYAWDGPLPQVTPELVLIKVHGDLNITIICDSFEVALEPLNLQYPHMV